MLKLLDLHDDVTVPPGWAVADIDVTGLDGGGVERLLREIRSCQAQLDGLRIRAVQRLKDLEPAVAGGGRDVADRAAAAGGQSRSQARKTERHAAARPELARAAQALDQGQISIGHFDALAGSDRKLVAEHLDELVKAAKNLPVDRFRSYLGRYIDAAAGDAGAERARQLHARRFARFSMPDVNGLGHLNAGWAPDQWATVRSAANTITESYWHATHPDGHAHPSDDDRTWDQRLADAIVEMARRSLSGWQPSAAAAASAPSPRPTPTSGQASGTTGPATTTPTTPTTPTRADRSPTGAAPASTDRSPTGAATPVGVTPATQSGSISSPARANPPATPPGTADNGAHPAGSEHADTTATQTARPDPTCPGAQHSATLNSEADTRPPPATRAASSPPPTPGPGPTARSGPTPAWGQPSRPEMIVLIDYDTLMGRLHRDGIIVAGGSIPATTARRLACDADIIPVVLGGDSAVLDLGRSRRLATPDQRRALIARDGPTCAIPDCRSPADHCRVHHLVPFSHGGHTDLDHLVHVCDRHHHDVHEGGAHLHRVQGHWHVEPPTSEASEASPRKPHTDNRPQPDARPRTSLNGGQPGHAA